MQSALRSKTILPKLVLLLSLFCKSVVSQDFSFAFFTDLHISEDNPAASEDLQNAVMATNKNIDISFVIVGGDITESGDYTSLKKAKTILDGLNKPYYILAGNHETKWSTSGYTDFFKVFGADKFSFDYNGFQFIGFGTGPIIKMGDGHILPHDIRWVNDQLMNLPSSKPIFIVTHYPLLPVDVDNWYEMTDILRKYNIQAVLGGHYHTNRISDYDGLTGIISRSTLKAKDNAGGFNIFMVSDSIRIFTHRTDTLPLLWKTIPTGKMEFGDPDKSLRPDYSINKNNKNLRIIWSKQNDGAIFTSPATDRKNVYFGDDSGFMNCMSKKNGRNIWRFKTGNRILSNPAVSNNKLVFGSTDHNIYCLSAQDGAIVWKYKTGAAVMGCPVIVNDTVLIGGSDGCFRAFDLSSGKLLWEFCGIQDYIEAKPAVKNGKIIFGAWDTNLYALNLKTGTLAWKWNNGLKRMHFSPAAVHPVVSGNKVFITAPDRYMTAIDIEKGDVIWRTKEHQVRETIGISADSKRVFSRYMNDYVIAVDAIKDYHEVLWKINAGFGYDHNPGMLVENNGTLIFGTKNGLLCGIDSSNGKLLWKYKFGNCIINTVFPYSENEFMMTTMDGIIACIKY
ncbi:MAG: PQQ-binding-like beta-propeller repeat protein [Deltaproteobacteria bacterium]